MSPSSKSFLTDSKSAIFIIALMLDISCVVITSFDLDIRLYINEPKLFNGFSRLSNDCTFCSLYPNGKDSFVYPIDVYGFLEIVPSLLIYASTPIGLSSLSFPKKVFLSSLSLSLDIASLYGLSFCN